MSETPAYHVPVMLAECLEGLKIQPDGVYVDVTFGGGGHSRGILTLLTTGKLFAFDQDPEAFANVPLKDSQPPDFELIPENFRYLQTALQQRNIKQVDGILADLGVSSHQFDSAERGFSTRFEAQLDMRMNQNADKTAAHILNEYPETDLHRIFGMYGELTNARTAANAIIRERAGQKIETTTHLKQVLQKLAPWGKENQYFAQVFQALRIEVNDELKALEEMLLQIPALLKPGGRLVVMAYHSLEDRLVKNFIREGKLSGEADKDRFGNRLTPLRAVNRKVIVASEAEIVANSRARSAKLRIAERW
jgi:16S rRNA (cytosine1402-N4)-methyltransferase